MSGIRSFLRSFHVGLQKGKKQHRVIVVASICTIATGTLILTGEEQHVAKVGITAEAKENTVYKSANMENASYQVLLAGDKQSDQTEDTDLFSKYCTEPKTVVSTIIKQTKDQVQDKLQEKKQILETDLKESARVEKKRQEEISKIEARKKEYKKSLDANDINVLERIVEAEAGDQDVEGRMLVANVVLNRVKDKEFPDTVKGVVFEHRGTHYQFSPAKSGSVNRVKISKTTKKAVSRVVNGEDKSQGALYFVQRNIANKNSLSWFDRDLTRLFRHGCHTFYK